MNPELPAPAPAADPGAPGEPDLTAESRIPLVAKVAGTIFLAVLIPIYLRTYGPANFLWFCDAALILTVIGMRLESSLIVSMCAVGILLPQCLWLLEFGVNLLGFHFLNLTSYMFDRHLSLFTRSLSLFHGWLPLLLVWLLTRLHTIKAHCLAGLVLRLPSSSSATLARRLPARIWPTRICP